VRASERYLVLEFGFNLKQGWEQCSHTFFSTTPLIISTKKLI